MCEILVWAKKMNALRLAKRGDGTIRELEEWEALWRDREWYLYIIQSTLLPEKIAKQAMIVVERI